VDLSKETNVGASLNDEGRSERARLVFGEPEGRELGTSLEIEDGLSLNGRSPGLYKRTTDGESLGKSEGRSDRAKFTVGAPEGWSLGASLGNDDCRFPLGRSPLGISRGGIEGKSVGVSDGPALGVAEGESSGTTDGTESGDSVTRALFPVGPCDGEITAPLPVGS
jgi:hypothetical protein